MGFRVEVLGFKEFGPRAGAAGMLFFFKGVFCCSYYENDSSLYTNPKPQTQKP